MRVHFIAIGGSAMHNLAIALHKKGYRVSGSDDEIFEPSKSRLDKYHLLPEKWGWFPEKIGNDIDAVILGMHARIDNPELIKAQELGLKVYSYPEYLFTQTSEKFRVVVGGSHGKTTVTSMIMHVLNQLNSDFDFMVGAQLEGFNTMVNLSKKSKIAVFEGDEYLSSPIDLRPKFLWYKPHVAIITGIAWDHINVFPTLKDYKKQFELFIESIIDGGTLIYYKNDVVLNKMAQKHKKRLNLKPYELIPYRKEENNVVVEYKGKHHLLNIFGKHNVENLCAAMIACGELGISGSKFLQQIASFKGAARRLQVLRNEKELTVFYDFAHSPSKLKATTNAVKEQFESRELVACMELHTFSSLDKNFLSQYKHSMNAADKAIVYFNHDVVKHKGLPPFSIEDVIKAFDHPNIEVFTDSGHLIEKLKLENWKNKSLLIMTSGNFNGVDIPKMANQL
ncbi:MAG: peptidoglycan synthetase [Marinilabiliaceae bacterium]|nr:peptidoglycan synthetase [Marinilabiliaceae bacterium]